MSDFHKNLMIMFISSILSCVVNMESFASFKLKLYGHFSVLGFNMEIYVKMTPTFDEDPITFFLGMILTPNFHKMCKTKLY